MTLIAIDGRAGAGKTTLAENLRAKFANSQSVQVIHMDDLYDGWENALSEKLTKSLERIISAHLSRSPIDIDIFNWHTLCFDSVQHIDPTDLLILEGVGAGQEVVRTAGAPVYWLDIDSEVGIARVLKRDGEQIALHMNKWRELQEFHFLRDKTRENAEHIQRAFGT